MALPKDLNQQHFVCVGALVILMLQTTLSFKFPDKFLTGKEEGMYCLFV